MVYLSLILLFRKIHVVVLIFLGLSIYYLYGFGVYYLYLFILRPIVFPISSIRIKDFLDRIVRCVSVNVIVFETISLIPYIFYPFIGEEIYENDF